MIDATASFKAIPAGALEETGVALEDGVALEEELLAVAEDGVAELEDAAAEEAAVLLEALLLDELEVPQAANGKAKKANDDKTNNKDFLFFISFYSLFLAPMVED